MRTYVLVFAALALGLAAAPLRAERVDLHVPLGTAADGSVDQPGAVFTSAFLVNEGLKKNVSIAVKRSKGSAILLDVRLIDPDGDVFDFDADPRAKEKAKEKSYKAKLKDITSPGMWRLEVRGVGTSVGGFRITMKGKDTQTLGGTEVVGVGAQLEIPFQAADGGEVTVQVKRSRGSALVPDIVIVDPNGFVVPESDGAAVVNTKSGSAKLKKFAVPLYGAFTVRISGSDGSGGGMSYKVKSKPKKYKGELPVADAGESFDVEPGTEGRLDGSKSTGSGLTYLWGQVHGSAIFLDDPASDMPAFIAPDDVETIAVQLSVFDDVRSRPRLVAVEVAPRPLAIPGFSQVVAPSANVTVTGLQSVDVRGSGLLATWRVISGGVALNDPSALTTTFVAPASGVVRLGLVVSDGRASSIETEHVVVVSPGAASVADAGRPQRVPRMATVHMSGLASQRAAGPLNTGASWTQISGPPVTIDNADSYFPAFTAPRQPADLLFELTVDALPNASHRTWVFVRDDVGNSPPVGVTNPAAFPSGGAISLNAVSSSDPNGDSVFVRWAQLDGTAVTIADADALQTTATGATATDVLWSFAILPRDELAYGPPEHIRAAAVGYSGIPFANAGVNRTISGSQPVNLDGSLSVRTSGTGPIGYTWRQVSAADWYDVAAEDPGFDPLASQPGFALPPDVSSLNPRRTMTFELVVTDGLNDSAPDYVTLTFLGLPLNGVPLVTAGASDLNPLGGQLVALVGTADDRDGDPVTVSWSQIAGPAVGLSPSSAVLSPTLTAPSAGTMTFRLTGNDGFDDSLPADVTVTIDEAPIAAPTVSPQQGDPGTLVTISGSNSSDPELQPLTYFWEQTSGTSVSFDSTAEQFTFNSPAGVLTFRLTVNDGRQNSQPVGVGFGTVPPPVVTPSASVSSAAYGGSVTLTSNPANNDTNAVTFTWRQISGPSTALSSLTAQNPTFSVPLPTSSPFGGTQQSLPTARFGVRATRQGQDSAEATVDVTYFASYNNTSLTTASNTVYGIVSSSCISCHSPTVNNCGNSGARKHGLNGATVFRTNTINVAACSSSKSYVVPGDPGNSFTLDRLKGLGTQGTMPPGSGLGTTRINLIEDWIRQGGQNN